MFQAGSLFCSPQQKVSTLGRRLMSCSLLGLLMRECNFGSEVKASFCRSCCCSCRSCWEQRMWQQGRPAHARSLGYPRTLLGCRLCMSQLESA